MAWKLSVGLLERLRGRGPKAVRVVLTVAVLAGFAAVFHWRTSLAQWVFVPESAGAVGAPGLTRPATPGGSLVICGGGALPDSVRDRFLELAGGSKARIVVIPTAHAYADGPEVAQALEFWKGQPLAAISLFHTRSRQKADDPSYVRPITEATGVWFGGGRQQSLADAYLGTEVERQLKALLDRGGVIGGTSAGAAVMSRVMIASGRDVANLGQGFDFLHGAVVDQHFLKRNRMKRLQGVVRQHPDLIGFGIDEQTALVVNVRSQRVNVIGNSYVIACLSDHAEPPRHGPAADESTTRVEILKPGDEADLAGLKASDAHAVMPGLELDRDVVGIIE